MSLNLTELSRRLGGYVRIQIKGYSPERFLNLCNFRGLDPWDIRCRDGVYELNLSLKGFRQVQPLVRKARVRLVILEKRGLPFFLYRNRSRRLWLMGLASFFGILWIMSRFLWDIEFQGNIQYSSDTLIRCLKQQGIDCGILKSRVNCESLEHELRTVFPEITWVSVQLSGTRLLISIRENQVISQPQEGQTEPADLVASKGGIITSMIVRSGTAVVSIGDQVEEGQLLVQGSVPILDDGGQEIRREPVRADADIVAQTVCRYQETIPLIHRVRFPTGKENGGWFLRTGDFSYTWLLPMDSGKTWDYILQENQLKLLGDFYLPVYYGTIQGLEMEEYECLYTDQELKRLSEDYNRRFAENLQEKGVQILENNDRIKRSADSCILEGQLTVLEEIQKTVPAAEHESQKQQPGSEE